MQLLRAMEDVMKWSSGERTKAGTMEESAQRLARTLRNVPSGIY